MGVTTTQTNKPFNPRGNDQSPLAFNRAKLYSGKALDFDGVNDSVLSNLVLSGNTASLSFYLNWDDLGTDSVQFICEGDSYNDLMIHIGGGAGVDGLRFRMGSGAIFDSTGVIQNGYNHYALTTDGTTASAYVNGVLFNSETINLGSVSITEIGIGNRQLNNTLFLDGQIAGFKIFNTALTAAQVADLYNNPEKVVPTGVANTALKLWLPMQEGAGTYCINGADPLGADEYNGAGSFDSATGWTLNTGTSITGGQLVVDGTQTASTSAYYNISSVASSLAMVQFTLSNVTAGQIQLAFFGASGTTTKWYTSSGTYTEYVEVQAGHNGNTGFIANADFVGNIDNLTLKVVNTGAISGATWTHGIGAPVAQTAVIDWNKETTGAGTTMLLPQGLTTGRDITGVNLFENVRKQGALNLDGNSWAEVHDNASLDFGTGGISMELWSNIDDLANYNLMGKWNYSASKREYNIFYSAANNRFECAIGNGANVTFLTANYTADGDWFHIVLTADNTNIKVFINGSQSATTAQTHSLGDSDIPLMIGTEDSLPADKTLGQIAQPRIYNRALTAEEVQRNYNAGKNTYTN